MFPAFFEHLRVRKNDRFFRSAGFGEGTPQQVLTGTEEAKAEIWATGRYLLLVSDRYPALRFFTFLLPNLTDF